MKLHHLLVLLLLICGAQTDAAQNFCSNSTVLRTRTSCHSCSISLLFPCPAGFRPTPQSAAPDCKYYIRTPSMQLALSGCSFECYKEQEVQSCCPGYWGPDCMECPERADKPCSGRGTCSEGLGGNGTCSCQEGFTGTACEDCEPGRYGTTCSSVCSCVHGLCDWGITGNGRCTCFSGYKGPTCEQESPACASLSCQLNSRCMEEALTGQLVCQCLPGYRKSGDQCLSINPCLQRVCHVQATCLHTGPNQHQCSCNPGYSGDGRVCMVLDPCQNNQGGCDVQSARCVFDGPGKSHCECLPGFDLFSNGTCILRESCKPDSCHKNANCSTVEPGRVKCTCLQGYLGNGKVCYGNIMQRLVDLNTEPGGQWNSQLSNAIALFDSVSWPLQNLGPFTIFVPTNKGFRGTSVRTLTADVSKAKYTCKMHLVAGTMWFDTLKTTDVFYTLTGKSAEVDTSDGFSQTKIRIHGSRRKGLIVQSDLVASNGMIHIINRLMDSVAATVESNPQENLMKIISDYGKFDTFKSLLEKTKLDSIMDLPGPITVFAPTSSAFLGMMDGHLQYLSSEEGRSKLVELLRNHMVPSTLLDVYNAASISRISTMANQVLTINVTQNGQMRVNGEVVTEAAVEAKNGRLYVMDGVLTPPSITPVLPHRCDVNQTKIVQGDCVSCSKLTSDQCSSGVYTGTSIFGCVRSVSVQNGAGVLTIPVKGCRPTCNQTTTTAACCKGFYGPDCRPCPGGYQTSCSGHGQCLDGMEGNGTCICETNFRGSRCQYCSSPNKFGPNCDRTCPCIHGQCENRPDSDGRCKLDSCQPRFTGRFCERSTAFCGVLSRFCHAHAECVFNRASFSCVCKPGFQGDGITCVEADPCAPPLRGGCSVNAKCIKTGAGKHTCQCLTGWKPDGDECQPINNCDGPDRGGCHDNATCIYVGPGQSDCSCKSGYKGDGHECEAVNQCVTENGGCHYLASCRLLDFEWKCVCEDEYVGDGRTCFGSVQQELMVLPDASTFYSWTTKSGLSGLLLDQNVTLLVPSPAAVSRMSLDDQNFWTSKGNLASLIRNHVIVGNFPLSVLSATSSVTSLLSSLPVSTRGEVTVVGGASITTADVAATNGLIHIIDKVLVPDRKLSEGLLATLAVRPEFSLFRSYLIDYNLTDEIEQSGEFTIFAPTDAAVTQFLQKMASTALDVNTTRYHIVASQRLLRSDLESGGYKQSLLGFSFQLGIFPRDGKLFVNDAQINSSDILSGTGVIHGLSAVLQINRNRCDEVTYEKVLGPCIECLFHQNKLCPDGSKPNPSVSAKKCILMRTFEGERRMQVGCRATCMKENTVARCCGGFYGEHCEPCPGPKARPCSSNGQCSDGTGGSGVCRCQEGFNGTACETCKNGRYGVHCDQNCECVNGRCNEGLTGDGSCDCDVGWRGIHCDQKVESRADELCGSVKCHSSANCVSAASGPLCLCAAGFRGNGTFCSAVDPCRIDNGGCSLYAVCKRTRPGRRECVCNSGYHGDGLVCVEINPCLEGRGGCHDNADCVHIGPNKRSCVCSDGYSGDGRTCSIINLCGKRNGGCHQRAHCSMVGPGTRNCSCIKNFVGDGLSCKGTVEKEMQAKGMTSFFYGLVMLEIHLRGRGPFTVFSPQTDAYDAGVSRKVRLSTMKENFGSLLRNHIVMCHTLLPEDLRRPRNLTALSGLVLTTASQQDLISINEANLTRSDDLSTNGIIHDISRVLFPPGVDAQSFALLPDPSDLNLTDVADQHGYKTFFKLLEETGVLDLINDPLNQPLTVFLPTDAAMTSLPQEQKDFLFHQHNRAQLLEYLKFHVMQSQKVYAEGLIYLDSGRTLQGSQLSFSCGGTDDIGEIFINDGKCRIVQRHLVFRAGIAFGIDCLLTPPSLGGRCDQQNTVDLQMNCGICSSFLSRCPAGMKQKEVQNCDLPSMFITKNSGCRTVCTVNIWQPKCCHGYYGRDCLVCPGGVHSPCSNRGKCDDGHLGNGTCTCEKGFGGVACELCGRGFYGPTCKACNCSEHGSCDDGRRGSGVCFCDAGWSGDRCHAQTEVLQCSPSCSPKAVCRENNTCVCRPFYQGDGLTCTVMDVCQVWNGGCAKGAKCSQTGEQVSCTCPKGHTGDGYTCQPVDPCVAGDNGGCHEHASCTMTAPGKRKCSCKDGFIGDGITCQTRQLPISRCLQDNGNCHLDATCTDLHFEDATLGVFHLRSSRGQYKLNFSAAQQACSSEGGSLATYTQLSYAQQAGMNLCAAGWLDEARVGYPTTYSNPNCGFGHVGIVDYGTRKNLSETWDTFCYRMKEVKCECKPGYLGDGFSCTGNLLQVLRSTPTFSNFLTQILNYSQVDSGKQFVRRLSNLTVRSTLFVPDNSGLPGNQTLSYRDLEFHLAEGQVLPVLQLKNGSRIRTRVGSLTVLGVADLLNPSALSSCYINGRFVTSSDIQASNGIIHVLQGPLEAPPPQQQMRAAHRAGMGVGLVLLVVLVAAVVFVGFHFYRHKDKHFQFHYFKEEDVEEESAAGNCSRSISNPVYEASPGEPESSGAEEDKHQAVNGGSYDLLQDS